MALSVTVIDTITSSEVVDGSGQMVFDTSGLASGDMAVAVVCSDAGGVDESSITGPDGTWNARQSYMAISEVPVKTFDKLLSGSPPSTYTFNLGTGAGDGFGFLLRVRDSGGAVPTYQNSAVGTGGSTTIAAPDATFANSGIAIRVWIAHPRNSGSTTITEPTTGFTNLVNDLNDDNYNYASAKYQSVTTSPTGVSNATLNVSRTWGAFTLVYAPIASGSTETRTFSIDAIRKKPNNTRTFSLNAVKKATATRTFNLDAIRKATGLARTFSIDALVADTQRTFSLDAFIKKFDIPKSFLVNANIVKVVERLFQVDANLADTIEQTFNIDAILDTLRIFSVDAVLFYTTDLDFYFDGPQVNWAFGTPTKDMITHGPQD